MTHDPIDVHVGKRLRLRRAILGMSQQVVAQKLGVSFQQVQKYEQGTNRISASSLFDLGGILAVPVNYFFEEIAGGDTPVENPLAEDEKERISSRETLELMRYYYRISNLHVRKCIYELIKALVH